MYKALSLTLIIGLFFLVGIVVLNKFKSKSQLSLFTTALALVVMLGLLCLDLLPELIESKNLYLLIPLIGGFLLLVILDHFIPHHYHNHLEKDDDFVDHQEHLNHIGIVTIIALTIHNLIEGLTLYLVALNDFKSGILMMMGISLHNIPLGFQIGNSLKNHEYNKLLIILLCSSSFIGGVIAIIFGGLNDVINNALISLTFGMLLYILIYELYPEVKQYFKEKTTIYGIIVGVVILILTIII